MVEIYRAQLWNDGNLERFNANLATLTDQDAIRSSERARYDNEVRRGLKVTR